MLENARLKFPRLFTVPYFPVRSLMSIVEFDGPPSWSLDASETGESTKCPWVVAVGLIAWTCLLCASISTRAHGK